MCFFFPFPFPIYLLWPEAPANNSIRGSQYCVLQTWPHVASAIQQAKKGNFCAAMEIESLEDLDILLLPPSTMPSLDLGTPGVC